MTLKRLIVEIDELLHAEAKTRAYSEGKTIKEKITELIQAWLGKE